MCKCFFWLIIYKIYFLFPYYPAPESLYFLIFQTAIPRTPAPAHPCFLASISLYLVFLLHLDFILLYLHYFSLTSTKNYKSTQKNQNYQFLTGVLHNLLQNTKLCFVNKYFSALSVWITKWCSSQCNIICMYMIENIQILTEVTCEQQKISIYL